MSNTQATMTCPLCNGDCKKHRIPGVPIVYEWHCTNCTWSESSGNPAQEADPDEDYYPGSTETGENSPNSP